MNGFNVGTRTSIVSRKTAIRTIPTSETTEGNKSRKTSSRLAESGGPSNEDLLKIIDNLKTEFGKRIKAQDKRIKAQDKTIATLQSVNVEQDKRIKAQDKRIKAQDNRIVTLESEIMGVRAAFDPASLNALMETAVAYSIDGVKDDYSEMSKKAYLASKFVSVLLTSFVGKKPCDLSKVEVPKSVTLQKAVEGAVVFVKTLPKSHVKNHWPPDRNLVSHDSVFLKSLNNLSPKSGGSTASNNNSGAFLKVEIVQFMKDLETINKYPTWEEALLELYRLIHDHSDTCFVRNLMIEIHCQQKKRRYVPRYK